MKAKTTALCFFIFIVFSPWIASGQIKLDGTLKEENAGRQLSGPNFSIPSDIGIIKNGNLFHSFEDFNIRAAESATFSLSAGDTGVNNVLSRVTGGNESRIDGLLRSIIPDANFWFLNPAGVVFGPNAQLDIDGAFNAGAANWINFENGDVFGTPDNVNSVLSISKPTDFGFFEGSNATLTVEDSTLAFNKGVNLSGGQVDVTRATIAPASPGSGIEVDQGGEIHLTANGALNVTDSLLETNENGLGSILLNGGDIQVTNSNIRASIDRLDDGETSGTSIVEAFAAAPGVAGDILIQADNSAKLTNTKIETQTSGDRGKGGDIRIEAPLLEIEDASRVATTTTNNIESGRGGGITIVAQERFTLSGKADGSDPSTVETISYGEERGGDITVRTPDLTMDADSTIQVRAESYGDGGDIALRFQENTGPIGDGFALTGGNVKSIVGAKGHGKGGDIHIGFIQDTEFLDSTVAIRDTRIVSTTQYAGDSGSEAAAGGDVFIKAENEVSLVNSIVKSETAGDGEGGRIQVESPVLNMDADSTILSETQSYGDGGDISLAAAGTFALNGGTVKSEVTEDAYGKGGNINIGFIQDTEDPGIYAATVDLDGATVLSSTKYEGTCVGCDDERGSGGGIKIAADEAIELSQTRIESETTGTAAGGEVVVDVPSVSIEEQTALLSSTRFEPSAGGEDNYSPHGGPGGDILVDAVTEFALSGSTIETETTGDGRGGEVEIRSPDVLLENESTVLSKTGDLAKGGGIDIEPCSECGGDFRFHIKDDSLIKVEGGSEYGGRINIFRIGSFGSEVAAEDIVFGTPLDPLADATQQFDFGPGGIVLDGLLEEEGPLVQPSGPDYVITEDMGVADGENLFHYFSEFNLASGESATFTKNPGERIYANIISKVRGGGASSIDGAIISEIPGANFYFINPSGVFFGPNATIDTAGAFVTAAAQPRNFPELGISSENPGSNTTGSGGIITIGGSPSVPGSGSIEILEPSGAITIAGFFGNPTGPVRFQGTQLESPGQLVVVGNEVQVVDGAELVGGGAENHLAIDVYASEAFTLSDSELIANASEGESTSSAPVHFPGGRIIRQNGIEVRSPVVKLLNESEIHSESGIHMSYTGTVSDPSRLTIQEGTVLEAENAGDRSGSILVSGFDEVRSVKLIQSPVVAPPPCPEGCEGNPDEKNTRTVETVDEDIDFALEVTVFDQTYNHIKTACRVRPEGGERGGLRVVKRRGLPASPEDLLMAYHPDIMNAGQALEVAALPPGTQPALAEQFDTNAPQVESARALTEGTRAFRGGNYDKAGEAWKRASKLYASLGNQAARGDALRKLAETQQVQGKFSESIGTLQEALKIAKQTKDKVQAASLLTSLGNANVALGDSKTAKRLLTRGLKLAQETGQSALVTTSLNNLGNLHATEGEFRQALRVYEQSARAAKAGNQNVQFVKALSNGARAALKAGRRDRVRQLLDGAFKWAGSLEDSSEKVAIWIHLAKSYEELADTSAQHEKHGTLKAYESLMGAYRVSKSLDEFRARSFALGNLGRLYKKRGRLDEALYVTRVALNSARTANAPELIYRWLWQEGRILWSMGRRGPALRAYRRAVTILEDTRQESLVQYGSSSAHFHRIVSPVYMDLVDALVQASTILKDPAKSQLFLVEARDTLEKFRASELREYFRDECFGEAETRTVNLEGVSETAAVVYPVLFRDRVDLLVSFPDGIRRFTTPVDQRVVTAEIHKFRQYVERGAEQHSGSARRLYDWLIRPFEMDLHKAGRDTLVFVPDGPLRSVPMSALNDGDEFLVEKFAIAVTPSLTMTQPEPLDRDNVRLLLAGLSEAVQDFSALESVPQEVANIKNIYGGDLLMNQSFTVNNFGSALKSKEMSIVHIASHGSFTGREKENFLLAYDGKIHMDKLRAFIGPTRTRENPIELLVLSACETAAGDDRAALGLAGVAIQAGARSAMGSLWKISDAGTTQLIAEFYQQLKNPGLSKAQALQRAQKKLLASQEFRHPFFWSPFLMINNWL